MSAAHTPGPWVSAPFSSIVGAPVVSQQGRTVAKVSYPYTPGMPQAAIDECVANGHLIAAAPDLLAALKLIEAEASLADVLGYGWDKARAAARAAIAKAEARP